MSDAISSRYATADASRRSFNTRETSDSFKRHAQPRRQKPHTKLELTEVLPRCLVEPEIELLEGKSHKEDRGNVRTYVKMKTKY